MNKNLEKIWQRVPVDYYQRSVAKNILQRIWHRGRINATLDFMKECQLKDNSKILDVGCASGWFISEIAHHYPQHKFFGIDIYRKAINYAEKHYSNISFSCADAHKLLFSKDSFDLVICANVLEHVVNPEQILTEIKRVVKPQRKVLINMDSENFLFSIVWYLWKKIRGRVWKDAHLHKLEPIDLEKLFSKTGLRIEKRRFFNLSMAVIFLLAK